MNQKIGHIRKIYPTNAKCTGAVIFLHGSGGTGAELLQWVKSLVKDFSLPYVKFLFPTAPIRRYTAFAGQYTNVWFDRYEISPDSQEHIASLNSIGEEIIALIQKQVSKGIPLNRIIVGGFSMGGALALHTAYNFVPELAGAFALSSFLNNDSLVYKNLENQSSTRRAPLFMCHGDEDPIAPLEWGQRTFYHLTECGVTGEFHVMKETNHELKADELKDLKEWIKTILP